jgi:hypothetical protein
LDLQVIIFGKKRKKMKFNKFVFIVLTVGFFLWNVKKISAEVVVFRQPISQGYGNCYHVSLNENIIASTNGQSGAGCDFSVETRPSGEWVSTGSYFDSPPYAWNTDSYYTSGGLTASFTCTNLAFTLNKSNLPSYIQVTKEEDLPQNSTSGPGKKYSFSISGAASQGASFNLPFSFQTQCIMKSQSYGELTPVSGSSSCGSLPQIEINPRQASLNYSITIGYPCGTPTPVPPTPTFTPVPTSTPIPSPTIYLIDFPKNPAGFTHPFSTARPSQIWRCMKSEYYQGDVTPGGKTDHRLKLTGNPSGLPSPVYIIGCINTATDIKCTTGDDSLDTKLSITKDPSHFFIVDQGNPLTVPTAAEVMERVVYSHSENFTTHTFFLVAIDPNASNEDQAGSIQYGTFKFTKPDATKCSAVRWDPYGRVFDGQTLQPIGNIKVSLLNKEKHLVKLPGLINPTRTDSLGIYSFLVEPGEYYLSVEPPEGYEFTTHNLNPDYKKYYSNIYQLNELIIEKPGKIELRDVPLIKMQNNNLLDQLFNQIVSFIKE